MKKRQNGFGTKLLMAALFLGVAAYFGIQAFQYLDDPLGVTLAYRYEVEQAVDLTGFVVREEQVLPDGEGGLLRVQRAEGERVAAGGTVASVYADQASLDRQAEIDSLESRVEQLQYAQNLALAAETTRKLDAQIAQNLLEYRRLLAADRLYDAESVVLELRALVLKRDYSDAGGEDAELGAQLLTLRSQAEGTVRRVTAPEAGLYSAEVDGYETVLTPEALDGLTPSGLAALTANPADPAAVSRTGKLVLGDEWRYAAVLPFEDAAALQSLQEESGGTLCLRFSKGVDRDLPAVLESIGPREDGRVVAVFRGTAYLRDLTLLRQQRAQIITGVVSGIRIPRESLRAERAYLDENGKTVTEDRAGVYCLVGREARFKPVEVVHSGESFILVAPAPELDQSVEKDAKRIIRPGEQVIVSARGLFDGKVLT